jgi:hypothetical protein
MNPELSRALVSNHIRDLRRDAALAAGPAGLPEVTGRAAQRPQLRSRVGFALVEAGLRLLADRSALANHSVLNHSALANSVTARPGLD